MQVEDTDEDDPAERPVNRNWSNLSLTARGGYDRSSSARKQAHADILSAVEVAAHMFGKVEIFLLRMVK